MRILRALASFISVASVALSVLSVRGAEPNLQPALQVIKQAVENREIPGAALCVARNGKVIAEQAYGVCDIQQGRGFQVDTICWIASLTKRM